MNGICETQLWCIFFIIILYLYNVLTALPQGDFINTRGHVLSACAKHVNWDSFPFHINRKYRMPIVKPFHQAK
jgi:hypothetical protein